MTLDHDVMRIRLQLAYPNLRGHLTVRLPMGRLHCCLKK